MLGVDEFRSEAHARKCREKAESRLSRWPLAWKISLISTAIIIFGFVVFAGLFHNETLAMLFELIGIGVSIAASIYGGCWSYFTRCVFKPFHEPGFLIIALIMFALRLEFFCGIGLSLSELLLLYTRSHDRRTLEATEGLQ